MTTTQPRVTQRNLTVFLLFCGTLLVGAASPAGAVPYLDSIYGGQAPFLQAEINAMGGSGVALYRGAMSNVLNPAFLVTEEHHRLDLAISGQSQEENRYIPLFDSFESRITDTVIASNRHYYFNYALGYAQRLPFSFPMTLALSFTTRYPFDYTFEEEIRNPDGRPGAQPWDQIWSNRSYEVDGGLQFLSLGTGVGVTRFLALGATLNYAFGTRKQVISDRVFIQPDSSFSFNSEFDQEGINGVLGAMITISERLELGLSFETRLQVSGESKGETVYGMAPDSVVTTSVETKVRYPWIFGGGFTYRPRNDPLTVFTLDAVFAKWSDLEDSRLAADESSGLVNTMDFRIGLLHTFYNKMPVRFGYRLYNSYTQREAVASVFTAGLGMLFAKGRFDFSFEIGKITGNLEHIFPYPEYTNPEGDTFRVQENARVEDTSLRVGVGYTLSF